ncbi:MAG: DNA topoisomerase IV subunit B [Bacteroidota bacterium]
MADQSTFENYGDDAIKSLDPLEHIRLRPGMYIGKLGDGSTPEDGIYILLKEVIDNSIDEFMMGVGKTIEVTVTQHRVRVRDYGRGIPLGKVVDCVSKINTGGKFDSSAFQKSIGLNGVGTKAVNALSSAFAVQSYREGRTKLAEFEQGQLTNDPNIGSNSMRHGTLTNFTPDETIFKNYRYNQEFVENLIRNYVFLNRGLTIVLNGTKFLSKNGLRDLLEYHTEAGERRYPIIHFQDEDIEVALTHTSNYGEQYYSFVNGQHTTQGGTHQKALREAVVRAVREFYGKNFDATDVRASIVGAIAIRVQEPVFESQTKTKLGSTHTEPGGKGRVIRSWINEVVKTRLDNFLHRNPDVAEALLKRIKQSERERKDIAGIKKLANERARKANLHNRKLRDSKAHFNSKHKRAGETMIFITEGDSASGSITKARDPQTQAVFSLKGKPLNSFGLTKKVVYENEEFNLLQHALNIEDGIESLRYNQIVIATDADVDGMHIRLLLLTFFLQFFPELVRQGHVYILQTPLFRVRNKKETIYCYDEAEKQAAMRKLGRNPEITRFKGLGEISPDEFSNFIGEDIRLEPVIIKKDSPVGDLLRYYMGKNSQQRQEFIIDNLRVEKDLVDEVA